MPYLVPLFSPPPLVVQTEIVFQPYDETGEASYALLFPTGVATAAHQFDWVPCECPGEAFCWRRAEPPGAL
jgi:hypothetical protein